jgi:dihydropteroate synthase
MNVLTCGEYTLDLKNSLIMGILNVTPDSFSDGGEFTSIDKALNHAKKMVEDGANIIDIGGESTRPGSQPVSVAEELNRVLPIVERLLRETNVPLSIDTMKHEVAEACLKRGVHILNDVSGLRNPEMIKVAAKYDVPVIIMHMLGNPKTMQETPRYTDVVSEIKTYLRAQATQAKAAGISQIIVDPGLGFGKTLTNNLNIIKNLHEFSDLGYPILVGPSRKSFIGQVLNQPIANRLSGSIAATIISAMNGANIIRVHDVKECKQALDLTLAILNS